MEIFFEGTDWITLLEASRKSGISVDRLRRLIKSGKLKSFQLAGPHTPHVISETDLALLPML